VPTGGGTTGGHVSHMAPRWAPRLDASLAAPVRERRRRQGRAPGAQDLRGWAPRYDERARAALRSALFAARHALADSAGPLPDGRTGANLVPAALMGSAGGADRALDLSGFHTAVLWVGSALAGAALVRPRRRHA